MQAQPGPPAKRSKPDYNDTITVLVGPEKKRFSVHKELFCSESSYFKSACSKNWEEGKEGVIRLPVHDVESFHAFVHWVYSKEVALPNWVDSSGREQPYPTWLSLGKLWALAHYLNHTRLRDATIDAMLRVMRDRRSRGQVGIGTESLIAILNMTPEDSTIQQLLLEYSLATIPEGRFRQDLEKLPRILLQLLAWEFVAGGSRPYPEPKLEERCQYHEHGQDEGCWDQKK